MANTQLRLTISKVDEPIFDGEVTSVRLPGSEGEMTILADHEPLISPLRAGTIYVQTGDQEETFDIKTGTLEISHNHATLLI